MTNFTRHLTAGLATALVSALLLVAAVGPANTASPLAPQAELVA